MCDKKYELVEEMAKRHHRSLQSYLEIIHEHMLKFEYMQHVQGTSWIESVANSRNELKATSITSLSKIDCSASFNTGMKECIKSGKKYESQHGGYKTPFTKLLPDYIPEAYMIENILDDNKISEFFEKYVRNSITLKELKTQGLIRQDAYPNMRQFSDKTYTTAQAEKGCFIKKYKRK